MTLGIMQPYFFPYIGYWQLIHAVDTFVIYDDVNFIKKGYINKNYILVEGQSKAFTLELLKASSNKQINEIYIGNNQVKLLKTIKQYYSKAPYFKDVYPLIEDMFNYEEKNLAKFLGFLIKTISKYLNITTDIIYSSSIDKDNTLKGQTKIFHIAKKLNATSYINAIGGQDLYSNEDFKEENIKLNFLETKAEIYNQYKNEFVANLSIVDIMMFNSVDVIKEMLNKYELI